MLKPANSWIIAFNMTYWLNLNTRRSFFPIDSVLYVQEYPKNNMSNNGWG